MREFFLNPGQAPIRSRYVQSSLWGDGGWELPPDSLGDLSQWGFLSARSPEGLEYLDRYRLFSLDIETYGYHKNCALLFLTGGVRLITVCFPNDKVVYWDSFTDGIDNPFFQKLKTRIAEGAYVVGHNLKFDMGFLIYHFGFIFRNTYDTMLASQVLWSGVGIAKAKANENRSMRCKMSHSLEALCYRLLGVKLDKSFQTSDWSKTSLSPQQIRYACEDSRYTLKCWNAIAPKLKEAGLRYSALCEFTALPAFAMMETVGIPVDTQLLNNTLSIYEEELSKLTKQIGKYIPESVNFRSNPQLKDFLCERFGVSIESVDRESLMILAKQEPNLANLITMILAYRFLSVLLTKMENVRNLTFNGRVYTQFQQIAPAGTGRSSCTGKISSKGVSTEFGINTQTIANLDSYWESKIPKPRAVFKAPEGYKFIIYDLAEAHNRIACELSQDPKLIQIYKNNEDSHSILGYEIARLDGWKLSFEEFVERVKRGKKGSTDPEDLKALRKRQEGKVGNYSQLNQGGVATVQSAMREQGVFATEEQVRNIQKVWRKTFSTLYAFILGRVKEANKKNYQFDDICSEVAGEVYGSIRGLTGRRQFLLKQFEGQVNFTDSIAYMWLSSEADMVKDAMGKIYLAFLDNPFWDAAIFNMSHDEINVVCLSEFAEEVAETVFCIFDEVLRTWIRSIPVTRHSDPKQLICDNLSEK